MAEAPRRCLLLVDDEPAILAALERDLRRLVEDEHLELLTASSVAEADAVLQGRGDEVVLVLSDLKMPGPRGTEFLRHARAARPDLVLMVLTGRSESEDIQDFLDLDVQTFLTKPWEKARLLHEVRRGLAFHQLQSRHRAYQAASAREMEAAQRFQETLLRCEPPSDPRLTFDLHRRNAPDHAFSGDFVDVRNLGPDRWLVVLADVSGHGLKAAFTVALVKSIMDADLAPVIASPGFDPGQLAEWLNAKVLRYVSSPDGGFVSFLAVEIDLRQRRCRWVNAGQPPLFLIRGSEIQPLTSTNLPLGVSADTTYRSEDLDFSPGTRLFLCTDGVYPTGLSIEGFDTAFFHRFLEGSTIPGLTTRFKVEALLAKFGPHRFDDDITVLELQSC